MEQNKDILNADKRAPNLIIAGVHKAGTSSLFYYLSQHKSINPSIKKELHYFTPLRYGNKLQPIKEYLKWFKPTANNQEYTLEASPSYLYGGETIAKRIKETLGEVKILIILREPTTRLLSFYKHVKQTLRLPVEMNYSTFFEASKEKFYSTKHEDEVIDRGVLEGCYVQFINEWEQLYGNSLKIVFFEDLKKDPKELMQELCKWLKIDEEQCENIDFSIENKSSPYGNRILHKVAIKVNKQLEPFLNKNRNIKKWIRENYRSINKGEEELISKEEYQETKEFYRKHNHELYNRLKKAGENKLPLWLEESQNEQVK